ncbi:MAG TPA: YaiO family outer membrane beta-barrel protein [Bacteroidota bacterium]|nr:YaiO family outer membrane beta-barrel protein [Bacteroidota bacterium]
MLLRITKFLCGLALGISVTAAQNQVPHSNVDSLFALAIQLQRLGNFPASDEAARRVLLVAPRYHDARILVSRIHSWRGEYAFALRQLDTVLSDNPNHREARLVKAQVLAWQGKYDESVAILRSLADGGTNNSEIEAELGKVYLWSGRPKEAYRHYENAYKADSASTEVIRGLARSSFGMREYRLSLQWYQMLLRDLPKDREALGNINRLRYRSSHEFLLLSSYESFTRSGVKAHSIVGGEYYSSIGDDFKPFVHFSRTERFGSQSNRWGGGFYWTFSYTGSLLVQGLLAPGATVVPRIDVTTEATSGIGAGFEPVIGYRFLKFEAERVHIASPGITWYASGVLWFTPRVYLGWSNGGGSSKTIVLNTTYRPNESTLLRINAFSGNETVQGITLKEISIHESTGVLLGGKGRITSTLALELVYQFTSRRPNSNSHFLGLNASFLF